jgi:hypothetical protein
MFSFTENFRSENWCHSLVGDSTRYLDTTWQATTAGAGEDKTYSKTNNVDWVNYASPLVTSPREIDRTVLYFLKTNSISFFWTSNAITASTTPFTTDVYRITQPSAEIDFGFINLYQVDSEGFYTTYYSYPTYSYRMTSYAFAYVSNIATRAASFGATSGSTNMTPSAVSIDKAINLWDFKYK